MKKLFTFLMLLGSVGTAFSANYVPLGVKEITQTTTVYYYEITGVGNPATDWVTMGSYGTSGKKYTNVTNDPVGNPDGITDNIPTISSNVDMITIKDNGNTYVNSNRVIHMHVKGVSGVIGHGVTGTKGRGMAIAVSEYVDGLKDFPANPSAQISRPDDTGSYLAQVKNLDTDKEYIISFYALGGDTQFYCAELLHEVKTNEAPISWTANTVEYKIKTDLSTITLPTLINEEGLAVTYASSKPEIASIDEEGNVTLQNEVEGQTTISATYNGDQYEETVAEYTIKVITNVENVYAWAPFADNTFEFDADKFWAAGNSNLTQGAKILDDDNLEVSTVYDADANSYGGTFFGQKFTNALQLGRSGAAPSEDSLTGSQYVDDKGSKSSPFVVKPKTDLQLVVISRKQAVEVGEPLEDNDEEANIVTVTHYIGSYPNDGKALFAVNQNDVKTKLDQNVYVGGPYDPKADEAKVGQYIHVAYTWDLKAGETYTIYATGTTPSVNGIGYVLPVVSDVLVESIAISCGEEDVTAFNMTEGETAEFTATVSPEDATVKSVKWTVSDPELAEIQINEEDANIVTLKALAAGEVTLTAAAEDDSEVKAEVTVTIEKAAVPVTEITITPSEVQELTEGESVVFTATVSPDDATDKTVLWSVSDLDLASIEVDEEDPNTVTLTALGEGEVTLTAIANDDSEVKAEVTVKISAKVIEVVSITIEGYDGEALVPEATVQLKAVVTPEDADNKVKWTSSDESVATVSEDGLVTAVAEGNVTITATSLSNEEIYAECEIEVKADESSAIYAIGADANGEFNVYDTNGRMVIKTKDAAKVLNLNKGIYIINGKKIVVK